MTTGFTELAQLKRNHEPNTENEIDKVILNEWHRLDTNESVVSAMPTAMST